MQIETKPQVVDEDRIAVRYTVPVTMTDVHASVICACGWYAADNGPESGKSVAQQMREHDCPLTREGVA